MLFLNKNKIERGFMNMYFICRRDILIIELKLFNLLFMTEFLAQLMKVKNNSS